MTNAVAVLNGGGSAVGNICKKETKRKDGSWEDDVTKVAEAPKTSANAKSAASPLEVATEI